MANLYGTNRIGKYRSKNFELISYEEKKKYKIENNICADCDNPSAPNKRRCEYHLEQRRKIQRKYKQKNVKNGYCSRCGQFPPIDGRKRCQKCVNVTSLAEIKLKESRRKSSLCIRCGDKSIDDGVSYCEKCYLRKAATRYLGTSKRWLELRSLFDKQEGRCVYTGWKLKLGINSEIDHITAKSIGGNNDVTNLQWIYHTINYMKRDYTEAEFFEFVRAVYSYRINKCV